MRYHLCPLNYRETIDYIQYRISIAAQKSGLKFDRAAYRPIYKYSRGIPRLINVTLLTAVGLGRYEITGNIARASVKELKSRGAGRRIAWPDGRTLAAISTAAGVLLAAAIFNQPLQRGIYALIGRSADGPRLAATAANPISNTTGKMLPGFADTDLNPGVDSAAGPDTASDPLNPVAGQADQHGISDSQPITDLNPTVPPQGGSPETLPSTIAKACQIACGSDL